MTDRTRSGEAVAVLIIGSGPVGSTFARIVGDVRPDLSILIVEVGPRLPGIVGEHTMNMSAEARAACEQLLQGPEAGVARTPLTFGAPSSEPRYKRPGLFLLGEGSRVADEFGLPAASMASGVGGMGVLWAMASPRPSGSERISFILEPELDEVFDAAEQLLAVTKDEEGDDGLLVKMRNVIAAEFDGEASDAAPVGFLPVAFKREGNHLRASGTSVILGDLADRVPDFEIRSETLARQILVQGGVAVGALLEDRQTGTTYEVHAERVVVCADSFRTPQLLFASGIRPRSLGHYLNDHLRLSAMARLNPEFVRETATIGKSKAVGSVMIPFVDGVRPMHGQLVPMAPIKERLPLAGELADWDADELAVIVWYGAKNIQFSDAVEFSETETDLYGMPAMRIRYTLTGADRQTIELMRANTVRSGKVIGELLSEPTLAPGGTSLHYQGTVRMGATDDGESVCDTYGRVWAVEQLYVGSNGVIPTSTACNPTLTTVALAVRAARELARTL